MRDLQAEQAKDKGIAALRYLCVEIMQTDSLRVYSLQQYYSL